MNKKTESLSLPEEAETIQRIFTALIFNDRDLLKSSEVSGKDKFILSLGGLGLARNKRGRRTSKSHRRKRSREEEAG